MLRASPAHSLTIGEGLRDPLGFAHAIPAFSWKLPSDIRTQQAYRLEVVESQSALWDSGWVETAESTFVPYGGRPLESRQQVQWRVNFRNEAGKEQGWSEWAGLEVGLLSAADWKAQWIRPAATVDATREPVAYLHRDWKLEKPVKSARLYVTARGLFDVQINGTRVGHDHFANGFTSYFKRLETLTYDVTSQLQAGANTIEAQVAPGWYAGRLPFDGKVGPYGTDTGLLLQLEVIFSDGTRERLVSDDRWRGCFEGPIVSSSIYDGEVYDARRQPQTWGPVTANADLGTAALVPKAFAPIRATQTLEPLAITEPEPGRHVFDLGQNMVGWARIQIPVTKDSTITVRFAEMLRPDGSLYTDNYRSAKSVDTYTAAKDGTIEWEPQFTFHGFRYVELSGLPADARPTKDWVRGVVLHSEFAPAGTFQSSHAKLNQLQSNIAWGWKGNSLDIPTDCPQRDERMGWTGDAQVFCATSLFLTQSHGFWKRWLQTLRDDQYSDGALPPFIPTAQSTWQIRSPGWMDAATFIPWDLYVRTGDKEVLAENLEMMERLVTWYRSQSKGGLIETIDGFGDWLQPFPQPPADPTKWDAKLKGDTPLPFLGTAFYAQSARLLADANAALGHDGEARQRTEEANAVRSAFARHYFTPDGKIQNAPETQTGYVLALAFKLIPDELRAAAGNNLARLVQEAGGHLRTGFLGTPYLAQVLDETGHANLAAELLFTETYPSWFYPINQGATTMWERWNSYTRDQGFGDVAMNSFNHYAYGAIGQWMYERIAGLTPDPDHPGYRHFRVRPLIVKQLDSARAELETPYGKAVSGWTRQGDKVQLEIVVPANSSATVEFPDRRPPQTLPAGAHHFETTF